tara:strand:+ start:721 stop:1359 length:639 start_codon:yes stop_codon:yes gene_type:complete
MSAIIQKLQEISKLNITLPISNKSVQINKINLDLQSKLEQFAVNVENELQSSMQYLEFINNHIRKEINGDVEYLDKLFVLQQWHNDLKDDTIDQAIEPVEIQDLPLTINGAEFLFKFELPTVVKDLAFLKYILSKKSDIKSVDILFYFTFRYLVSVTVDTDVLEVSDIPLAESLFKLLDISKATLVTNHIDDTLESIKSIRNLEVDARVFFA